VDLRAWELAPGGQGRTAFAETRDGRSVVVKWFPGQTEPLAETIARGELLRQRGYPAPATLAHGAVPGYGQGCVQERLPGAPCTDAIDRVLLDQVMAAVALQADSGVATDGWSYVGAAVFEDEEGWWRAARARGPAVAAFCDRLEEWLREVPRAEARADFVHFDLNFSNLLASNGRLTGIVDLHHLGPSDDRSVDLVSLLFEFERLRRSTGSSPVPDAADLLRGAVLDISGEPGWRQAIAFRAVADLAWQGPAGQRVPVEETLGAARTLAPALSG
jgi:hypothetical protein